MEKRLRETGDDPVLSEEAHSIVLTYIKLKTILHTLELQPAIFERALIWQSYMCRVSYFFVKKIASLCGGDRVKY